MLPISPSIAPCKPPAPTGAGDTNLGVKWEFHKESKATRFRLWASASTSSFQPETPASSSARDLIDYWLNLIAQKSISEKTRINVNAGYLFAGNTSTGVLGITKVRGHVFAGGISLLHDFTPRLTLGGEVFGGFSNNGQFGAKPAPGLGGRHLRTSQRPGSELRLAGRQIYREPAHRRTDRVLGRLPGHLASSPESKFGSLDVKNRSDTIYFCLGGGNHGV